MYDVSEREVKRQYRLVKQTLSMHADLRDQYSRASCVAQIITLVASTFVCAMTFASDQVYSTLGLAPATGGMLVGFAGVAAFCASLALLVLDWRGKASEHAEAAKMWTRALQAFRAKRDADRTWPRDTWSDLSALYWQTDQHSVGVPSNRFTGLKARYLQKVVVSRLQSRYPGSPLFLIRLKVRASHTAAVLRGKVADLPDAPEPDGS